MGFFERAKRYRRSRLPRAPYWRHGEGERTLVLPPAAGDSYRHHAAIIYLRQIAELTHAARCSAKAILQSYRVYTHWPSVSC
jgi:hypothetical protein